jgi:uncharacterized protein YecT (DUF1311 family)
VNDLLNTLSHTPLPTILIVAGIVFWALAVSGSVAGKITVEPGKQKTAAFVGTAFIILGLILFFAPEPTNQGVSETTLKTTETTKADSPPTNSNQNNAPNQNNSRPSSGVDCTGRGTPDETAICGNATLMNLDWQLYGVYQALMRRLDQNQQTKLAREEASWVKQRGECQRDINCLTAAYKSRISQLQSAQ